jgi:hypothetical protein
MLRRITLPLIVVLIALTATGWTYFQLASGESMTTSAQRYLALLTANQRETAVMDYQTPQRVGWHFIPKAERKGLQIKDMTEQQRKAALTLLRSSLSQIGYGKATKIMSLEALLRELEKGRQGPIRDPERYYVTIFGSPAHEERWGLSFEGHHLSLNFVVDDDKVISSTPSMFGANPATVMEQVTGVDIETGLRVLADEEKLAFDLVNSLSDEQRKSALLADTAPREIRAAGEAQPPTSPPEGLALEKLTPAQREVLKSLIGAYTNQMPEDVARQRLEEIEAAGWDSVHFAWAGSLQPGIGHYYRVQGPTFLIEFVNTQPDAAGNPANHIHCVWRDPRGDFAVPIN